MENTAEKFIENEDVRKLSIKHLNELKDSGDPFAIEILGQISGKVQSS